jgi:hypothetical protein
MTMPIINIEAVTFNSDEEKAIARLIVKKGNVLRASKPKIDPSNPLTGKAAYVWRMVCFSVSPKRQHQCMPVTADFDLPAVDPDSGKWSYRAASQMSKPLDDLADRLEKTVPFEKRHGTIAWGRALGYRI